MEALEGVAPKYRLSSPLLRMPAGWTAVTGQEDEDESIESLKPVSPLLRTSAEVIAELDALDEDEVLVVVPFHARDEGATEARDRLARQEQALSGVLGPFRAGNATGGAYAWAYPLPQGPETQGGQT